MLKPAETPENPEFAALLQELQANLQAIQGVTNKYYHFFCDYRSFLPSLGRVRDVLTAMQREAGALAGDAIINRCAVSLNEYLRHTAAALTAVGESSQAVPIPSWFGSSHFRFLLESACVQMQLALHGMRFRMKYGPCRCQPLSGTELYAILCLFWETRLRYQVSVRLSKVIVELIDWFAIDSFCAAHPGISKEALIADLNVNLPESTVMLNDLFCLAHLFDFLTAEKLRSAVPPNATLEETLATVIDEANLSFLDRGGSHVSTTSMIPQAPYTIDISARPDCAVSSLIYEQSGQLSSDAEPLILMQSPDFCDPLHDEAGVLLNTANWRVRTVDVLVSRIQASSGAADTLPDYRERNARLDKLFTAAFGVSTTPIFTSFDMHSRQYTWACRSLELLTFCNAPAGVSQMLSSSLPVPLLDYGIISAPYLADAYVLGALGLSRDESNLIYAEENLKALCGESLISGAAPSQLGELLTPSLPALSPAFQKRLSKELCLSHTTRPFAGRGSVGVSSTASKTVTGSPIVSSRYIEREVRKSIQKATETPQTSVLLKLCQQVHHSVQDMLKACATDIAQYNPGYAGVSTTAIINDLFHAVEVVGYDAFNPSAALAEGNRADLMEYLATALSKLVIVYVNTAFLCASSVDRCITERTGQTLPYGGFACRLAQAYLTAAYTQRSMTDKLVATAFKAGIRAIQDLILARAGIGTRAFEQALLWRGLPFSGQKGGHMVFMSICDGYPGRKNYFLTTPDSPHPPAIFHNLGLLPLRSFTLPLITEASCLAGAIRGELGALLQALKTLPLTFETIIDHSQAYFETLWQIPRVLTALLALTEFLALAKGKIPTGAKSWMGGLALTSTFRKAATTRISDEIFMKRLGNIVSDGCLNVIVTGTPGSGVTSLIRFLTLQPLLQFAALSEAAAGDQAIFMETCFGAQKGKEPEPWYIAKDEKATYELSKARPHRASDTLSIGSWASCANSTSNALTVAAEAPPTQRTMTSTFDKDVDALMVLILKDIQSIHLTEPVVDLFSKDLDNELKIAMSATEDSVPYLDCSDAMINNNNLLVVTESEVVQSGPEQPERVVDGSEHFYSLFGLDATDFRPRVSLRHGPADTRILQAKYCEDGVTCPGSICFSDRFLKTSTSLPTMMYPDINTDVEGAMRPQGLEKKSAYQESLLQPIKKRLPALSFTGLSYCKTESPTRYTIDLLPLYDSPKVVFYDIPANSLDLNIRLTIADETPPEDLQSQEVIKSALDSYQAQLNTAQAAMIADIQQIHGLFQGKKLSQNLLTEQHPAVLGMVHSTTRQLQPQQVIQLQGIVQRQLEALYAEVTALTASLNTYANQLIQMHGTLAQSPDLIPQYKQHEQTYNARKALIEDKRREYAELGQERRALESILRAHPTIQNLQVEIGRLKQQYAQARETVSTGTPVPDATDREAHTAVAEVLEKADVFLYVYDCTLSIKQFSPDLSHVSAIMAPITAATARYVPETLFSDSLVTETSLYKRLTQLKVPGIIVCNKFDLIVTSPCIRAFYFGSRLAKLLGWPQVFVSSRTGAFMNHIGRTAILLRCAAVRAALELPYQELYEGMTPDTPYDVPHLREVRCK
ncbi:hypothetical protein GMRT_12455 [Giardia muris]|uniref:Uncharacterized protein n=1 Tax=Giardia muris TaxID=5742 RepID=A0A4Z1SR83_GIAMU|nr:hypothetical protein GMRT_12455 [Giardia muris]|eukprot:TNJ27475.1 hypothetical protein GMRT_12455 [Giardia muris]